MRSFLSAKMAFRALLIQQQLLSMIQAYRYNCDLRENPVITLEFRDGQYVLPRDHPNRTIPVNFLDTRNSTDVIDSKMPPTKNARYCHCWSPLRPDGTLTQNVFYCPADITHCGIPTTFMSGQGTRARPRCLNMDKQSRFNESIWPIILISFVLLSFYLFCTAAGRNVFGCVLNTIAPCYYNPFVVQRLIECKPQEANRIIIHHFRREARREQLRNLPRDWGRHSRPSGGGRYVGISPRPPEPRLNLTPEDMLLLLDDPTTNLRLGRIAATDGDEGAPRPRSLTLKTRVYHNQDHLMKDDLSDGPKNPSTSAAFSLSRTNSDGRDIPAEIDESQRQQDCTICYGYIEEGDRVGALPHCNHTFHVDCLKVWLTRRNVCPLCLSENIASPQFDENNNNGNSRGGNNANESASGGSTRQEDSEVPESSGNDTNEQDDQSTTNDGNQPMELSA